MERHNWRDNPDYGNDRRNYREQDRRLDESSYRGAYRLDTDSRHRDETTYDGFDMDDRRRHREDDRQGGDYVYRRSRNLQDNDSYSGYQYRQSYGDSRHQGQDDFGSRYGGDAGMRDRRSRSGGDYRQQDDRNRFSGSRNSNFNNDYGPDRYAHRRDENYGNMAGSLSFGYDGDYNSDPDYNKSYNPLSGETRSYRDNYTQRQPKRYGPPDRTGNNPDYDRY